MKFTIEIVQDTGPNSSREWDTFGTMVCWHKRYALGDEQPKTDTQEWLTSLAESLDTSGRLQYWDEKCIEWGYSKSADWAAEQYQKAVEQILEQKVIMLPLYLYDHSRITMSTTPFSYPWDSGQVGYIYVTLEDVRKEWSCKRVSAKRREQAEQLLIKEVEAYDKDLRGDVYGYIIKDEDGTVVDSCWGYYELSRVKEGTIRAVEAAIESAL